MNFTLENLQAGDFVLQEVKTNFKQAYVYKVIYSNNSLGQKYGLCQVLTDGFTTFDGSLQDVCDYLNEGTFKKLTIQEVVNLMLEK